ncbi:MAG: hypothetical protein WA666_05500 [Nitrospirota bacterium]
MGKLSSAFYIKIIRIFSSIILGVYILVIMSAIYLIAMKRNDDPGEIVFHSIVVILQISILYLTKKEMKFKRLYSLFNYLWPLLIIIGLVGSIYSINLAHHLMSDEYIMRVIEKRRMFLYYPLVYSILLIVYGFLIRYIIKKIKIVRGN